MAEPSFPNKSDTPGASDAGGGDDNETEASSRKGGRMKGGKKYSFSKVCPHKQFPTKLVDRKQFKSQKEYVEFLTKNSVEEHPWYDFNPPKHKLPPIRERPPTAPSTAMQKVKRLPLTATPADKVAEDVELDKFIVLEKEKIKKKKKKKPVSKMGFEIKVNKDLEFLLGVMADAKEVLIQKAIDFERENEEYESRGQKQGDIIVLKTIIQGMMFKVMDEHEEDVAKKRKEEEERQRELELEEKSSCPKMCPPKKKHPKRKHEAKTCKPCCDLDCFDEEREQEISACVDKHKRKEQTTKELVSFLKDLFEMEMAKKHVETDDKAISPYVSEEELETIVYSQISEDFLIEEAGEEEYPEEEEEEDGEEGGAGYGINKDAEGYVDMDEVKKRLEEIQGEDNEYEDEYDAEEDEFFEGDFDEWMRGESAVQPLMQDASAQFNYFLERKKVIRTKPKNITEDLVQFMRIVIMGDDNLREVMKEKQLIEFKRKQIDFMTMGMLIKKPKPCQCIKQKKAIKGRCKCKCCTKKKGKGKKMVCEEDRDMTYNIRPTEFMLMLQVLMNTLEVIEEQDKLIKQPSEVASEETMFDDISVHQEIEPEEEEEQEEDAGADDADVDD